MLLSRAASATGLPLAELARDGAVCLILVPTPDWATPVEDVWCDEMRRDRHPSNGFFEHLTSGRRTVVWCSEPLGRPERLKHASANFCISVSLGCHCVGISSDLALLPADLVHAADHRLETGPLTPADLHAVTENLGAGQATITFGAAEAAAVTPRLLRLARRQGQAADDYLLKLRDLLRREVAPPAEQAPRHLSPRAAPTLDRLHGMDEAVAWGRALASDLAAYREGELPWSAVDGGVLLSGPPGTGKTSFARALARTCDAPLVAGSYAAWLGTGQGHQGDLLRAMRKTFAEARATKACILFIDEVDSFPDRNAVTHDRAEWDVQVVNALLAEIDGLEGREGVVLVAACNLPHRLDPPLTRSGRLDRHIRLELPDRAALTGILREHLGDDLAGEDLSGLALAAAGATGADVERHVRGARRRARQTGRPLTMDDLAAEIGGTEDRSEAALRVAAIHEAGHALAIALRRPGALRSVSLRGGGGSVESRIFGELRLADVEGLLIEVLAGRAAEEVVFGAPSTGSGGSRESDLAKATTLAAATAGAFGFDASLGLVWRGFPDARRVPGLLRDHPGLADRVRAMLAEAYAAALDMTRSHRAALEALAEALLRRGAMEGADAEALLRRHLREDEP